MALAMVVGAWQMAVAQQLPQILSTNTTIDFHAHSDFTFTTANGTVSLSALARSAEESSSTGGSSRFPSVSCPVGSALVALNSDGTAGCSSINRIVSAAIAANQAQNQRVALTAVDFCNGQERWYNLNSARGSVSIASYSTQDVIFYRRATSGSEGGAPFGRRVGASFRAGDTRTVTAASLGVTSFVTGDYFCGTTGAIEALGVSGRQQRDLVPQRLNGTVFVIPLIRSNPQMLYVMALGEAATVSLYLGPPTNSTPGASEPASDVLYLEPGGISSFRVNGAGLSARITSTSPILISTASAGGNAIGTPSTSGAVDYTPVPPASLEVIGIPQSGFLAGYASTSAMLYCQGGGSTMNASQTVGVLTVGRWTPAAVRALSYAGPACRFSSRSGRVPVGALSQGDGDGSDAVAWLSESLMRQSFVLPTQAQHMTFICTRPGMAVLQVRMGVATGQASLQISGSRLGVVTVNVTTGPRFLRPGSWIRTTAPCYAVYDGVLEGDENILWGN